MKKTRVIAKTTAFFFARIVMIKFIKRTVSKWVVFLLF
jgi:hypothetical protein